MPISSDVSVQEAWISAWRFAAAVHNTQKVPGTDLPYLTHLGMVSMEVMAGHAELPIADIRLAVQCAILHDTMEDQEVAYETLVERFGIEVADGVASLSKNANLPKKEAMYDSLQRIRSQPKAVWCVKLADRISNLGPPPAHWTSEKIAAYREEAQQILDALREGHEVLSARLAAKIAAYPGL
jgi:(p)ppGpp synthase/HD superfamily hydrolase